MPKTVTVAAQNRYCQARMMAAQYNDKFLSRAGASEALSGVTEDSLKKYELDIVRPSNDVVAIMADAYNCPELRNWYCTHECALGKYTREIEAAAPEKIAIRLYNTTASLKATTETLFAILDGCVTRSGASEIPKMKMGFIETRKRLDEALALIEKMEKGEYIESNEEGGTEK